MGRACVLSGLVCTSKLCITRGALLCSGVVRMRGDLCFMRTAGTARRFVDASSLLACQVPMMEKWLVVVVVVVAVIGPCLHHNDFTQREDMPYRRRTE